MYKRLLLIPFLFACAEDGFKPTTHEIASEYADHVCAYFEACSALGETSFEDCVYLVVEGTCPEGGCSTSDEWQGDRERLQACLDDLDTADCADVAGDPPASCAGVL